MAENFRNDTGDIRRTDDTSYEARMNMAEVTHVFPNARMHTHMPFFDGQYLLFCGSENEVQRTFNNGGTLLKRMASDPRLKEQFKGVAQTSTATYREWKLFYSTWKSKQPMRVYTGLTNDVIECSPSFYKDGKQFHVSFIGCTPTDRSIDYRLYSMSGNSFDSLSAAVPVVPTATPFGFVSKNYICMSQPGGFSLTDRNTGKRRVFACSLPRILRITFLSDDDETLLITGIASDASPKTLRFSVATAKVQEVRSEIPVYKSSIAGKQLIVAHRTEPAREAYRLAASQYSLIDSKESVAAVSN